MGRKEENTLIVSEMTVRSSVGTRELDFRRSFTKEEGLGGASFPLEVVVE